MTVTIYWSRNWTWGSARPGSTLTTCFNGWIMQPELPMSETALPNTNLRRNSSRILRIRVKRRRQADRTDGKKRKDALPPVHRPHQVRVPHPRLHHRMRRKSYKIKLPRKELVLIRSILMSRISLSNLTLTLWCRTTSVFEYWICCQIEVFDANGLALDCTTSWPKSQKKLLLERIATA